MKNLIIKILHFKPDLGFDLSFEKNNLRKIKKLKIIGVSPPIFEMYSLKFLLYRLLFKSK